jgi:hypothetical protein
MPAIRAELTGNQCSALGVTARAAAPVLALCRKLVAAGHDPALPLEAYRGDVLSLRVRSIGEAAGLEINGDGTGFRRRVSRVEPGPCDLLITPEERLPNDKNEPARRCPAFLG